MRCRHKTHKVPSLPNDRATLILPGCAGHDRWLAARQGGIGGSEVGALIGVNEYETPVSVWHTKMNGGKDLSHLPAVEWGHRMEQTVADKTAETLGMVARPGGGLWADREEPYLRVTPDRFVCRNRSWRAVGVVECKTAGDDEGWRSGSIDPYGTGDGAAPLQYQAQLQWQLGILGLHRGWLGCLIFNAERDFYVVEVTFDPGWFVEMQAEATRFWHEHVLAQEPPMHDLRHPRTRELMRELHPRVVYPSVDLPDDAQEWLDDYRQAKIEADRANRRLEEVKNYFRMHVGDAAAGYLDDRKVVGYPEVTTSRVDVEALKRDYPDVASRVTVKSTHRRLTIHAPKEGK